MARALATGLAVIALLGGAQAQTGRTYDSIEGLVAMSDRACLGRVTSIEHVGDQEIPKGSKPFRVRFQVTDWIRGGVDKTLDILMASPGFEQDVKTMCELHAEVMLTIGIGAPNGRSYPLLQLDGKEVPGRSCYFRFIEKFAKSAGSPQVSSYIYDNGRIFDLELNPVSGRRRILTRARKFQNKHPEPLPCLWLQLPNAYLTRVGDPNAYGGVQVPVCPETRRTLLRILRDPESVLAKVADTDHKWERRRVLSMTLRVLEPFKDKETMTLVKRFARRGDPSSNPPRGQPKGYDVELEARGLLERWKVESTDFGVRRLDSAWDGRGLMRISWDRSSVRLKAPSSRCTPKRSQASALQSTVKPVHSKAESSLRSP